MIYVLLAYSVIKSYLILTIYQQSHYEINNYIKHFIYNFFFYNAFILLVLGLSLLTDNNVVLTICGFFIITYSFLYLYIRKHLVFTGRIIRLSIFLIIYILLIGLIPYVGKWLYALIEYTVIPLLLIEKGVSYKINRKYVVLAKEKIENYNGKKLIITGSYGKTSTKVLANQILNLFYKAIPSPKSYNTNLGIAKFINDTHINLYDFIILEYGASRLGDIKSLINIAKPDIAIITEIGLMHIDSFKSIENIVTEKMSLAENASIAVLNYDNFYIRNYEFTNCPNIISYGTNYGDYKAKNICNQEFDLYYKDDFIEHFEINLLGLHNITNFLAVLALAHYLGLNLKQISRMSKALEYEKNRLEIKKLGNRVILDDSFNSNLKGFIGALNVLKEQDGRRILLTPGIVEVNKYIKEINTELCSHIVSSTDIVILVGSRQTKDLYYKLKSFNKEIYVVNDFFEGYSLYQAINKCYKKTALLIENDLSDLYKRRFII